MRPSLKSHATNADLATWVIGACLFEYAATLVHHVYGALVYGKPERLIIALVMTVALVVTLGATRRYRAAQSRAALALFAGVTLIVWVLLLGVFEGGYNHAYKDLLFLLDVSPSEALKLHPSLMAGDYVYPPNDALFETSGVLQLAGALFTLVFTLRLIRSENAGDIRQA